MKVESIAESPLELSAILLTCIKQKSVLKPIFGLFESGHFTKAFAPCYYDYFTKGIKQKLF